jgi:hypothetical protein
MAGPVYKLWFAKYRESWYKLTAEERSKLDAQNMESLKQVGAELVTACIGAAFNEEWLGWGVEKYPDIEAVQKHTMNLLNINWFQYFDSKTYLGTEMPQM